MSSLKLYEATSTEEAERAYAVRCIVFCGEQGVSYELQKNGDDSNAIHIVGEIEGEPVAAGRIRILDGKAKLERIAVRKEWRGRGYGALVTNQMVKVAKTRGAVVIYMHAQAQVEEFYLKLGFSRDGDYFEEAGITHCKMSISPL